MATASATPPSAAQEVIFLDLDDDLGTVRAKLESSAADEVYLVIPRRSPILRTPLEFRILARLTHQLSSETIIVTGDGGRRALARQEGLRTRRSVRSLSHLSRPPGTRSWGLPALPDWLPLPSFTGLLLTTVMAGLAAVVLFGVLPVMKVTVSPQVVPQQQDLEIIVDPTVKQVDLSRRLVPGEILQQRVEVVGSMPASGGKKLGRDKARGEIMFISQNPQPVNVPRGTLVLTGEQHPLHHGPGRLGAGPEPRHDARRGDGRGAGHHRQRRRAGAGADRGTGHRRASCRATTARSPAAPTATARSSRPRTSAELKEQLQNRAREQALAELYARAGGDRSLVQQSVRLRPEGEAFDPGVDAEADQVNGRFAVVASAVVFNNSDFNGMVQKTFLAMAGPGFDLPISQLGVGTPEVLGVDDQKVRIRTRSHGRAGAAGQRRGADRAASLEESGRGPRDPGPDRGPERRAADRPLAGLGAARVPRRGVGPGAEVR